MIRNCNWSRLYGQSIAYTHEDTIGLSPIAPNRVWELGLNECIRIPHRYQRDSTREPETSTILVRVLGVKLLISEPFFAKRENHPVWSYLMEE